jgi:hypothetical protein
MTLTPHQAHQFRFVAFRQSALGAQVALVDAAIVATMLADPLATACTIPLPSSAIGYDALLEQYEGAGWLAEIRDGAEAGFSLHLRMSQQMALSSPMRRGHTYELYDVGSRARLSATGPAGRTVEVAYTEATRALQQNQRPGDVGLLYQQDRLVAVLLYQLDGAIVTVDPHESDALTTLLERQQPA